MIIGPSNFLPVFLYPVLADIPITLFLSFMMENTLFFSAPYNELNVIWCLLFEINLDKWLFDKVKIFLALFCHGCFCVIVYISKQT